MSDVLDQSEVDALLASVESVEDENAGWEGGTTLLHSRRLGGVVEADLEVRGYDFKRPERVSKEQMRSLEHLHEVFARAFGAQLSGFLRSIVECRVARTEQMTFAEFTHALPNPTCFNLLEAEALSGSFCLEVSPLVVYPVIDRLLGGGGGSDLFIPQRPLTAIEQRLVGKLLDRAVPCLREAWSGVVDADFRISEADSNPALVQIVPPNEVVVVISFELRLGERTGTMAMCIPYAAIEPVIGNLSQSTYGAYQRQDDTGEPRRRLSQHLDNARLPLSAVLARTTITLGELSNLEVGDVILTDQPAAGLLRLHVGGRKKLAGRLAQHEGKRAFVIADAPAGR
ncbi:flagellar motor switch protein FliM [Phycisphaera mikurensis]|uniref:Flagellar motor switch protein FliM n=1 Tax=Phycisphaera mikurensis (strain NBRC 102666 / KCTC 22515 / FYK2301M01) TaxID=1142394 RepID=I0IFV2_PHYMF|nr:flagellar motor switch protein FliM [Phycisphaera mikurensis]MBB6440471.1 flagellar motor switch protein FliM [Phycisphaera mikurensis]BAM04140.1 flagellar motor switch protein FliM [Phycisphaera mikurensis NBRC 102666]